MKILFADSSGDLTVAIASAFLNSFQNDFQAFPVAIHPAQHMHPKLERLLFEMGLKPEYNTPNPISEVDPADFGRIVAFQIEAAIYFEAAGMNFEKLLYTEPDITQSLDAYRDFRDQLKVDVFHLFLAWKSAYK